VGDKVETDSIIMNEANEILVTARNKAILLNELYLVSDGIIIEKF